MEEEIGRDGGCCDGQSGAPQLWSYLGYLAFLASQIT